MTHPGKIVRDFRSAGLVLEALCRGYDRIEATALGDDADSELATAAMEELAPMIVAQAMALTARLHEAETGGIMEALECHAWSLPSVRIEGE